MKYAIHHEFVYRYDSPVRLSTQYLRLTPRDTTRQKVLDWSLDTPGSVLRTTDGYGNVLHVLTIDTPVSEITIQAAGTVETSAIADEPSDFTGAPLSPLLFLRPTPLTQLSDALGKLADKHRSGAATLSGLHALARAIHLSEKGSAADGAHAFIACCRRLGVPARYVSGYLYFKGPSTNGAALHAWVEAWVEERWRSFDIAHDGIIGESHIKIAAGADYLDACPVRGVRVGGGTESLAAEARVEASQQ